MITPKIFSHPNTIARGEMTPLNVTCDRITISLGTPCLVGLSFSCLIIFLFVLVCFILAHIFSALACIFTFCSCIGTSGMY